jgi:hypothetical protein
MDTQHIITLVDLLSAHIGRSDMTIAKRAGVHTRVVLRLRDGKGCTVESFTKLIGWLDKAWPADLEWPEDVPRPSRRSNRARAA